MKVMGSTLMLCQAIVIGLAIPVGLLTGNYPTSHVVWTGTALLLLCLMSIGPMRRDRRTAVTTGTVVQMFVVGAGVVIHPFLVPGLVFLLVWALAVRLSAVTDAQPPVN